MPLSSSDAPSGSSPTSIRATESSPRAKRSVAGPGPTSGSANAPPSTGTRSESPTTRTYRVSPSAGSWPARKAPRTVAPPLPSSPPQAASSASVAATRRIRRDMGAEGAGIVPAPSLLCRALTDSQPAGTPRPARRRHARGGVPRATPNCEVPAGWRALGDSCTADPVSGRCSNVGISLPGHHLILAVPTFTGHAGIQPSGFWPPCRVISAAT
jgi:hypothetical protein